MKRREFFASAGLLAALAARASSFGSIQKALNYQQIRSLLRGRELFIIPFSHGDWTWTYTRHWTVERDATIFSDVLDILEKTPEYRFFIETWNEQLEPFLNLRPERIEELKRALRDGKVEVCGAVCNQHPAWMEAESQIRNLVIGRKLFENLCPGLKIQVMTHNDVTPGASQMPQILTKGGYRYYRLHRPDQAMTAEGVPRDFVWVGLDGTEILASRGFACGFMYPGVLLSRNDLGWQETVEKFYQQEIAVRLEPPAGNSVAVWLPFGCDDSRPMRAWRAGENGAAWTEPLLAVPEFIRKWNEHEPAHMSFATPGEFFRRVEQERSRLPRHNGILDPTMWTYWYGLNGNKGLRLWRTRTDRMLVSAECWSSCVASLGESYPESEFGGLWHDLLRTYSHAQMWLFSADYERQLDRIETTLSLSSSLREEATRKIASRVKLNREQSSILLFNDLPWERTEVVNVWPDLHATGIGNILVRDASGNKVPHQVIDVNSYDFPNSRNSIKGVNLLVLARVPAMGYTTLYFEPAPGKIELPEITRGDSLETTFSRIGFSDTGIDFLLDKETNSRYPGLGNIVYNEIDDVGPYHFGPVVKTLRWTKAKIMQQVRGPLRSSFTIVGGLGPHNLHLTGHLYPHARRVAFDAEIRSAGGSGHFLTLVGLPRPGRLFADVHFGVEERDVSRIIYKGEERRRKNVFYGDHWVDYSDGKSGIALLGTTGEKGYQFHPEENALGHFLLMTIPPATDWERFVTQAREGKGRHRFDYQFLLHTGDWREGEVLRRATEARHPILPVFADHPRLPQELTLPEVKSFLTLKLSSIQLSAFYYERGQYRIRLFEAHGQKQSVSLEFPFPVSSAKEVNFHGEPLEKRIDVAGSTLNFDVRPWEIVTLVVS